MAKLLPAARTAQRRSLAKTCSWRILASLDTFVLSYLITGHVVWAGSIAGAEVATKLVLYYVHERGWAYVGWGYK